MSIIHGTSANFAQEVTSSSVPVLIDFYADWCAPCRALAPTLEALASEVGAAAKIVKIDVDAQPALAQQFSVRSIPTIVIVKDGAEIDRHTGLTNIQALKQMLGL